MRMIELNLSRETGISLDELDTRWSETAVIDMWHSLMESRGIDIRGSREKAMDEGFTAHELKMAAEKRRNI